jgi:hypothetical protein
VDKPEAVMIVEKIGGEDTAGYLINADGLFLAERLDPVKPVSPPSFFSIPTFNLGGLNPMKSKYAAVRSYPNNSDIIVDLAYDNANAFVTGGPDITDARYVRVRMQHSFVAMPDNDFKPRRDDPRIGFFGHEVTDQTSMSATPYRDVIQRWNLRKKDPGATLSEPVEPIVYWIENTTPVEYRETVMEAGLKWNKAFEKAGFKNAVQIRIMPDDATGTRRSEIQCDPLGFFCQPALWRDRATHGQSEDRDRSWVQILPLNGILPAAHLYMMNLFNGKKGMLYTFPACRTMTIPIVHWVQNWYPTLC